jgi:hypothetical protein
MKLIAIEVKDIEQGSRFEVKGLEQMLVPEEE